jgi:hypothetical protein
LEKNGHGNIQFIPITIYYKKKYLSDYWLTNILSFDNEKVINYSQSLIFECHFTTEIKMITIKDYKDFKQNEIKLEWPNNLFIEKVVFKSKVEQDFCTVERVSGGAGYFVSEKLKQEIESAGCTGIKFLPIEQI